MSNYCGFIVGLGRSIVDRYRLRNLDANHNGLIPLLRCSTFRSLNLNDDLLLSCGSGQSIVR